MESLIPSATAILLKKNASSQLGFQVLLLRRNTKLKIHGGSWVFPGGKVDPSDFQLGGSDKIPSTLSSSDFASLNEKSQLQITKRAALRETLEEAGLSLQEQALCLLSRWQTPKTLAKRFDTWFFIGETDVDVISIDGGEILDFQWLSPAEAVSQHQQEKLSIPPATFVTLLGLAKFTSIEKAIEVLCKKPVHYRPRMIAIEGGLCSMYEEDSAYMDEQPDLNSKHDGSVTRHRLIIKNGQYEYLNDVE